MSGMSRISPPAKGGNNFHSTCYEAKRFVGISCFHKLSIVLEEAPVVVLPFILLAALVNDGPPPSSFTAASLRSHSRYAHLFRAVGEMAIKITV